MYLVYKSKVKCFIIVMLCFVTIALGFSIYCVILYFTALLYLQVGVHKHGLLQFSDSYPV